VGFIEVWLILATTLLREGRADPTWLSILITLVGFQSQSIGPAGQTSAPALPMLRKQWASWSKRRCPAT
jgi:hypothetical protein